MSRLGNLSRHVKLRFPAANALNSVANSWTSTNFTIPSLCNSSTTLYTQGPHSPNLSFSGTETCLAAAVLRWLRVISPAEISWILRREEVKDIFPIMSSILVWKPHLVDIARLMQMCTRWPELLFIGMIRPMWNDCACAKAAIYKDPTVKVEGGFDAIWGTKAAQSKLTCKSYG